jgi:hypothetical protein
MFGSASTKEAPAELREPAPPGGAAPDLTRPAAGVGWFLGTSSNVCGNPKAMYRLSAVARSSFRNFVLMAAAASLLACLGEGSDGTASNTGGAQAASGGTGGNSSEGGNTGSGGQGAGAGGAAVVPSGGAIASGGSGSGGGTAGATVGIGGGSALGGVTGSGGATGRGGSTSGGATGRSGSTSGGATGRGGATSRGGSSAGGTTGGGGAAGRDGSSSGGATGRGGATSTGGTTSSGSVFSQCRFHFGTIDSKAKSGGTSMIAQLDYFTPGWMGTNGDTFDQTYVCEEGKQGAILGNLVPVVVSYIAAGYVKRHHNLCDANVSGCAGGDLVRNGAQYIAQDWNAILTEYKSFATGYAGCWGTTRPIVFEMEPDWYQYTISNQTAPWTAAQAGSRMTELVNALKTSLPNARFSMDASPWVGANGTDNGKAWFANFDMSLFTFVNTSGGGTNANATKIRSSNEMTWSGLGSVTGKPILADTGYGANGMPAGHDANWDVVANINARIADGVIAIAQYNPNSNWGSTISGIRGQLSGPKTCP